MTPAFLMGTVVTGTETGTGTGAGTGTVAETAASTAPTPILALGAEEEGRIQSLIDGKALDPQTLTVSVPQPTTVKANLFIF